MEAMNLVNKKRFAWIMRVCLSAIMPSPCALAPVDYDEYEQEYRYNQEQTVPSPCRPCEKRCTKEDRLRLFVGQRRSMHFFYRSFDIQVSRVV